MKFFPICLFLSGVAALFVAADSKACPRITPGYECSVGLQIPDGYRVVSFYATFLDGRAPFAQRYTPPLEVDGFWDSSNDSDLGLTGMAFSWTYRLRAVNDEGDTFFSDAPVSPVFTSGPCACEPDDELAEITINVVRKPLPKL